MEQGNAFIELLQTLGGFAILMLVGTLIFGRSPS